MSILHIIENYLNDSEIIGGIIKIFRKLIQVLSGDSNGLIDESKNPKLFAKEFKVNYIYK